jgi:hypothetical protein
MTAHTDPLDLSDYEDLITAYRAMSDTTDREGADMPSQSIDSAILFAASANSRRRRLRSVRYAAVAAAAACAGSVALISHHLPFTRMPESLPQKTVTRVDASDPTRVRPGYDVTKRPVSSAPLNSVLPEMRRPPAVRYATTLGTQGTPGSAQVANRHEIEDHVPPRPETPAARIHQDVSPKSQATIPTAGTRVAQAPSEFPPWRGARTSNGAPGLSNLVLNAKPAPGAEVQMGSVVSTRASENYAEVQHTEIDLNEPGALDRLARDNPDHYAKIRRILAEVDEIPEQSVGRWMKAQFNATDITYSPILFTSNPPQKELSFTLEATHYEALIILTQDGARLLPARPQVP